MRKFYCIPNCTTCKRVSQWFEDQELDKGEMINLKDQAPSIEELKIALQAYEGQIKKLINTSGQVYRQMGLKDKINDLDQEEVLHLLSDQGMLVKRPFIIDGDTVTVGGKENQLDQVWK